jgi:squalene-associated FAD-dependent desaturase
LDRDADQLARTLMAAGRTVAVVGGGWAGLAAAVEARRGGADVTLFEMAPQLGGRARDVSVEGMALDNGQHIAIGAYSETLTLLRELGMAEEQAFLRTPLRLVDADGKGLILRGGPSWLAFVRGVLAHSSWSWADKLSLLRVATGWLASGFRCPEWLTVADLSRSVRDRIRRELIEPLCIAALNTEASAASARVFLRVLRDALFSGPGASDLLLPRRDLGKILPIPAARWLEQAGATVRLRHRVRELTASQRGWLVDDAPFDAVVLAATASESARLVDAISPTWAQMAGALSFAPIVTVYLRSAGTSLPRPMLALYAGDEHPAQFVFDRGQLGGAHGLLAFVISGAEKWVSLGSEATLDATRRQAIATLGGFLDGPIEAIQVVTEKRATFRCTPSLRRPSPEIADRLWAAGDYLEGPYPSTLEGAVRSGIAAGRAAHRSLHEPASK